MKNLIRKIVVFFTAIFLSISIGSVSFADGHGKKILFSIKGPGSGNPFWASVTKGAEEEAKKLGVKLILIAPPQEGDVQAQINQVEDQLAKGVDALALAPGDPNAGLQSELDAIAACIIGGASFFGGRGTVLGVFAGVMIMGILRNGLNLMDVSSFWQQVLIGSIIVLAVYIDVLRRDLGTRK